MKQILSAAILLAASFNAAAAQPMPGPEARRFQHLCLQADAQGNEGVYARFLPAPLEHAQSEQLRDLLMRSRDEVRGFIDAVENAPTASYFLLLQKIEMQKALTAFDAQGSRAGLPSCGEPFPAP